jgi:hypothetical protein
MSQLWKEKKEAEWWSSNSSLFSKAREEINGEIFCRNWAAGMLRKKYNEETFNFSSGKRMTFNSYLVP